ncbi:MAG: hypothetical protein KDI28_06815 [Pseudomonadales bacterium]|nr:hypothetical protein [Pseudomonadales bacterium]MCP5357673.1 hypothetical protein [Pseudomonadales bacterium]
MLEEALDDDDDELDVVALGIEEERDEEEELDTLGLEEELELLELELELDDDELDGIDGMELCEDCCCEVDSQAASASEAMLITSSFLIGDFFMELTSRPAGTPGNASVG